METTKQTQGAEAVGDRARDAQPAKPTVQHAVCEGGCGEHSDPKRVVKDAKTKLGLCGKCRKAEFEKPAEKRMIKTAEEWATERRHFPQTVDVPGAAGKNGVSPAKTHNQHFARYQQARFHSWGGVVGKEMTLAEYDAGVAAAETHVFR